MNNKEVRKFISKERVCFADLRVELNKLIDKHLSRLDFIDAQLSKEDMASPIQSYDKESNGKKSL